MTTIARRPRRHLWRAALGASLVLGTALGAAPAGAQIDPITRIADQPAATLLLPYFEVDLDDPDGTTTLFSINNASATAILAHVVVWSDLSVPVLAFNVYLTGYDVQQIDMRDVLAGRLPRTASVGQDPGNAITPRGILSQDINFASCTGILPPPLDLDLALPGIVAHLRAALTGGPSPFFEDKCSARSLGDSHARGYVTVDTVNFCTLQVPGDAGYGGGLTFQNVLWGDFVQQRAGGPRGSGAWGDTLVHVLADNVPFTNPEVSVPGQYTFYARYVATSGLDRRQPLATTFAARYLNQVAARGVRRDTSLVVWRDPKVNQHPFTCGTLPAWYPLNQEGIVAFDEQEHPTTLGGTPFPAATQLVRVGGPALPVPAPAGWLFLNLNTTVPPASTIPAEDPAAAQAWVVVAQDPTGRLARGFRAIPLDSATAASHVTP